MMPQNNNTKESSASQRELESLNSSALQLGPKLHDPRSDKSSLFLHQKPPTGSRGETKAVTIAAGPAENNLHMSKALGNRRVG